MAAPFHILECNGSFFCIFMVRLLPAEKVVVSSSTTEVALDADVAAERQRVLSGNANTDVVAIKACDCRAPESPDFVVVHSYHSRPLCHSRPSPLQFVRLLLASTLSFSCANSHSVLLFLILVALTTEACAD